MRARLLLLADFVTETNLYISVGAALFSACSYWFFGLSANVALTGLVFSGTLLTYNFQRWAGDLDQSARFRKVKYVFMALGLLGALLCALTLHLRVLLVLLPAALLSVAYAVPIFAVKARYKSLTLRKVPHLKAGTIVLAWLLTGVVAPWADLHPLHDSPPAVDWWLLLLQQGCLVLALTAAFDIRDFPQDLPEQRTLPQVWGVDGTKKLARNALHLSAIAATLLYLGGCMGLAALLAHGLTLLAALWLNKRCHPDRHPLYYGVGVDGLLLLQGALVWVAVWGGVGWF